MTSTSLSIDRIMCLFLSAVIKAICYARAASVNYEIVVSTRCALVSRAKCSYAIITIDSAENFL